MGSQGCRRTRKLHIPADLVVESFSHALQPSRGEDLEVEEPVLGWDCSSFHFHPTLAGMLRSTLIRNALPDATDKKDPVSPQACSLLPGIPEGY
jgi:hypothetical protein